MNKLFTATLAGLCLLFGLTAQAGEDVTVSNAWVRATVPGQAVGAAYMELKSAGGATLTRVESTATAAVEIHKMSMKDGKMEMRMLDALPLPAGQVVKLEPGGLHLMLFDLKKPLKAGEKVGFTLYFKDGRGKTSQVKVEAPVRAGGD